MTTKKLNREKTCIEVSIHENYTLYILCEKKFPTSYSEVLKGKLTTLNLLLLAGLITLKHSLLESRYTIISVVN